MKAWIIRILKFILKPLVRKYEIAFTLDHAANGKTLMRWRVNNYLLGSGEYDTRQLRDWLNTTIPGHRMEFQMNFSHLPAPFGRLAIFDEEGSK